jgi:hypothetical protein
MLTCPIVWVQRKKVSEERDLTQRGRKAVSFDWYPCDQHSWAVSMILCRLFETQRRKQGRKDASRTKLCEPGCCELISIQRLSSAEPQPEAQKRANGPLILASPFGRGEGMASCVFENIFAEMIDAAAEQCGKGCKKGKGCTIVGWAEVVGSGDLLLDKFSGWNKHANAAGK